MRAAPAGTTRVRRPFPSPRPRVSGADSGHNGGEDRKKPYPPSWSSTRSAVTPSIRSRE